MVMFWLFLLLVYFNITLVAASILIEIREMGARRSMTIIDVIVLSVAWPIAVGIIALAKLDDRPEALK